MDGQPAGQPSGGLAAILATIGDEAFIDRFAESGHTRYALYQKAFSLCREEDEQEDELALMQAVLRDPDSVMAQSAVAHRIAAQAAAKPDAEPFARWAATISDAIEPYDFLTRRLREWTVLFITLNARPNEPEAIAAFATATDWLQRKVAEATANPAALAELEQNGRTRRVRTTAARRIPAEA